MNAHSSTHVASAVGTAKSPFAAQKKAAGEQNGEGGFASHVDADHVPPSQAARTALEDRPDLAGRPFGAIVSLFARHEELPALAGTTPADSPQADEPAAPETGETEAADPAISG
jgi:hypothetical protein